MWPSFLATFSWILLFGYMIILSKSEVNYDEILHEENEKIRIERQKSIKAQWNLESNITDYNEELVTKASKEYDHFRKQQYNSIKQYLTDEHKQNMTKNQRRQFERLGFLGFSILDENEGIEFKNIQIQMEKIYSGATINTELQTNLTLEPDLTEIFATSTNESLLKDIWIKWRDVTGKKMRKHFVDYVYLGNKAAKSLGYNSIDDVWMFDWEKDSIKQEVERLLNDLMNLYEKIHAYVRFHLAQNYNQSMPNDGTIPAHLLGNMWGQTWSNLLSTIPTMQLKPNLPSLDSEINEKLQNWTVKQMFQMSEKFFNSLGMENMTRQFWEQSIIEKRNDVEMVCHASAWDMFQMHDFRIKQCTRKTLEDLVTIHHEMGHIQYYMNYENKPAVYREGANPGFHEAIGDLMSLSVITPVHLAKVGLLNRSQIEQNLDDLNLNYQLRMAMDKIAFLPFSFIIDKWRWDVFNDDKLTNHMNRHWWELRLKYQGISPPIKRSEKDFDPGSKYHIPAGVEYVRYFVSHILQFQFYKHLCQNVTKMDKLYQCDFYENKMAGKQLIEMLQKGSSDHWENILKDFIGTSEMSTDAIYEYFAPLNRTLSDFIMNNKISVGWNAKVDDYFIEEENSSGSTPSITMNIFILTLISIFIMIS
ncbi:hypothetical protein DERP_006764 [Dermatophagoides pteronyssinus]|uniref:Uncharacterized protein n=2 Tax=Dermatophagoides pteronyssinus TaxID=6956 RepID=A0ABQ8IRX3_DERPT|nr:angiotensin-converting enzyme-like [Dermatophagoides pteronyssinus]KAH9413078.1 hypothetical protein DERP_006764 [Dermatophagoides pteronyssinus]